MLAWNLYNRLCLLGGYSCLVLWPPSVGYPSIVGQCSVYRRRKKIAPTRRNRPIRKITQSARFPPVSFRTGGFQFRRCTWGGAVTDIRNSLRQKEKSPYTDLPCSSFVRIPASSDVNNSNLVTAGIFRCLRRLPCLFCVSFSAYSVGLYRFWPSL